MARALTKNNKHIYIFHDPDALVDFAIEKWYEISYKMVEEKDVFTVALSGGKTPIRLLQKLALHTDLPWNQTHIFLVDERIVPLNSPDSNYHLINKYLIEPLQLNTENIHQVKTNTKPQKAAQQYAHNLRDFFKLQPHELPQFDLIFLGIGEDGHTASLFPDTPKTSANELTLATATSNAPHDRVTLTLPVINNSKQLIFLVTGVNKTKAMQEIIAQNNKLPAAQIKPQHGKPLFLLDEAAAKKLTPQELYQLSFYVPESDLERVKTSLFNAGAGKLGNYDNVSWQTKGMEQFRPLAGSKPHVGKVNQVEQVPEYKVEMLCAAEHIQAAIAALKSSHPYEEPAYNIIKLENANV